MFRFDERIATLKSQAAISKPKDVLPDALALIDELHRAYQAAWADECNSTMAACGLQADLDEAKKVLRILDDCHPPKALPHQGWMLQNIGRRELRCITFTIRRVLHQENK